DRCGAGRGGKRFDDALGHEGVLPDIEQEEYDPTRYRAMDDDAEYEHRRAEEERARHGHRDI
ncbi:hypothetical protein ABZ631_06110, partial [Nocardiopsis alba]